MELLRAYQKFFSNYFYGCPPDIETNIICTVYSLAAIAAVITMFFVSIQF